MQLVPLSEDTLYLFYLEAHFTACGVRLYSPDSENIISITKKFSDSCRSFQYILNPRYLSTKIPANEECILPVVRPFYSLDKCYEDCRYTFNFSKFLDNDEFTGVNYHVRLTHFINHLKLIRNNKNIFDDVAPPTKDQTPKAEEGPSDAENRPPSPVFCITKEMRPLPRRRRDKSLSNRSSVIVNPESATVSSRNMLQAYSTDTVEVIDIVDDSDALISDVKIVKAVIKSKSQKPQYDSQLRETAGQSRSLSREYEPANSFPKEKSVETAVIREFRTLQKDLTPSKIRKKFYPCPNSVVNKLYQTETDILKLATEAERLSEKTMPRKSTIDLTILNRKEIVPFRILAEKDQGKKTGDTMGCEGNNVYQSSFLSHQSFAVPKNVIKERRKKPLLTSSWTSKNTYLRSSQDLISDTQIFNAMDDIDPVITHNYTKINNNLEIDLETSGNSFDKTYGVDIETVNDVPAAEETQSPEKSPVIAEKSFVAFTTGLGKAVNVSASNRETQFDCNEEDMFLPGHVGTCTEGSVFCETTTKSSKINQNIFKDLLKNVCEISVPNMKSVDDNSQICPKNTTVCKETVVSNEKQTPTSKREHQNFDNKGEVNSSLEDESTTIMSSGKVTTSETTKSYIDDVNIEFHSPKSERLVVQDLEASSSLTSEQNADIPKNVLDDHLRTKPEQARASNCFTTSSGKDTLAKGTVVLAGNDDNGRLDETTDKREIPKEAETGVRMPTGSTTVQDKKVELSKDALAEGRQLLAGSDDAEGALDKRADKREMPKEAEIGVGMRTCFFTGSGKKVELSKNALAKGRQLLADCDGAKGRLDETVDKREMQPEAASSGGMPTWFTTGSGKKVELSKNALAKGRQLLAESIDANDRLDENVDKREMQPEAESGVGMPTWLTTGSGKKVEFSKSASAKGRQLLAESDNAKGRLVGTTDKRAMSREAEIGVGMRTCFFNGSGKKVELSKNASAKDRQLLAESDDVNGRLDESTDKSETPKRAEIGVGMRTCFFTGSGKEVELSKNALDKGRRLLAESDDGKSPLVETVDKREMQPEVELDVGMSAYFTTGSGKKVELSKNALAKGRQLLAESDNAKGRLVETTDKGEMQPEAEIGVGIPTCFTTGSGKKVELSKNALAKGRQLLAESDNAKGRLVGTTDKRAMSREAEIGVGKRTCFFTGSGKKVELSKKALDKGRQLLAESDDGKSPLDETTDKLEVPREADLRIEKSRPVTFVDKSKEFVNESSQSLNQSYLELLEDTIWEDSISDDWNKADQKVTPSRSKSQAVKRPASSQLSQSPKKRMRQKPVPSLVSEKRHTARQKQTRSAEKRRVSPLQGSFLSRKRSCKQFSWQQVLPEGPGNLTYSELLDVGIKCSILDITVDNASSFVFNGLDFYRESTCISNTNGFPVGDGFLLILDDFNQAGVIEFERSLLAGEGVDKKLLPDGWVRHHYGLIVWKYACYERACPAMFAGKALTPHNVMLQLKYRYDREIDRSHSSSLKKILQRDDSAAKPIVLCIVRIRKLEETYELHLSDGWYVCPAITDFAMCRVIESNKLKIGTKILTIGAELVGCDQGTTPLEMTPGIYLKIATNSTRRVPWYKKLGFLKLPSLPTVSLSSIIPGGGNICRINVTVARVYPVVYIEKTHNGDKVTRNQKSEEKAAMEFQSRLEEMFSQWQHEMRTKAMPSSKRRKMTEGNIEELNPEELYQMLQGTQDSSCMEALLNDEQKRNLTSYLDRQRSVSFKNLQNKLQESKRNVTPVLRVKLAGVQEDKFASLSWWQPDEDLISLFKEGKSLSLLHVSPGNSRYQDLYLSSTRQSRVSNLPTQNHLPPSRCVVTASGITAAFNPAFGELDFVGIVVFIDEVAYPNFKRQTAYLTDSTFQAFFGLIFRRGMKEFAYEDIIVEGSIVSASNVHWLRTSSSCEIPCGYVQETTVLSQKPRSKLLQEAMNKLSHELDTVDLAERLNAAKKIINDTLANCQKPEKPSLTDSFNSSIESPKPQYFNALAQRSHSVNKPGYSTPLNTLRLQGRTTPLLMAARRQTTFDSPLNSSTAQKRMERLQRYDQLPPLSPIFTRCDARKGLGLKRI